MPTTSTGYGRHVVKLKTIDKATMEDIVHGEAAPAIRITGNIGRGSGYGFARNGDAVYGEKPGPGGIYQKRWTGYNNTGYRPGKKRAAYYVRMRMYRPTNPQTPAQNALRTKFQQAVAAWQTMSEAERDEYKKRAVKKSRRGRNLFIQEYMLQS